MPSHHSTPKYLPLLSALFITILIISNIIAVKIASFGGFFLPAAIVLFPISYLLSNIITEVYGYAVTRRIIWTGFICNIVAVCFIWLSISLPPAPFFTQQAAFSSILGPSLRILTASFIAFTIGGFANAFIMATLKVRTSGRFLWLRAITSTIVGEGLDSLLFLSLAFAGSFTAAQIASLILTQWAAKVLFEIVAVPVTYAATGFLKRSEKIDHYDTETDFTPLSF